MVKKNNKTLESVLRVLSALDNKVSQPLAEQTLKTCDGNVENAVSVLRSAILRDQIAARKAEAKVEKERNELLLVASVTAEMSSLLGTLTIDTELLNDMIRSEKYNVEMCIERYLELIEVFDTDDFANCAYSDGPQESSPRSDNTFPSSSSSTNSSSSSNDKNHHPTGDSMGKESGYIQSLSDENEDASAGITHCSQSNFLSERSGYSSGIEVDNESQQEYDLLAGSAKEGYFSDDYINIDQNEHLECSANLEFEKEREQIDLAMTYTNQHGNENNSFTNHRSTGINDFTNGQYSDTFSNAVDEKTLPLPLSLSPEGEMEVYMSVFEGLIDHSELRTFWHDSYLQNSSNKMSGVTQKVDYSLVMNDAISFALVHLDDEESDWNEVVYEAEMMNSSNSNNELDIDNNSDNKIDIKKNIGSGLYTYVHSDESDREGNSLSHSTRATNDQLYPENYYYNSAYGFDIDTDESLNYDLLEQLASSEEEEYIRSKMQQSISTREALTDMVKNVIGDLKSKFSDNFILHVLGMFDYNLDKTVDFLILNQDSQSVSEGVLRNIGASNGHNNMCNTFADSSVSYADVLSSNMGADTSHRRAPTGQNGQFYSQNNFTDSRYDFPNLNLAQNPTSHQYRDYSDSDISQLVHNNDNNNDNNGNNNGNNGSSTFNPWHYSEGNSNSSSSNGKNKKTNNTSSFGIFYDRSSDNDNNNSNDHNGYNENNNEYNDDMRNNNNLISNSIASAMRYKRIKSQKAKSLQWRLVASKESAKMKESLSRESSQRNLPQINSENRAQCKQRLLMYGNMAAKYALEAKNPNLTVSISESGKLEFSGFTQKRDLFHGNQNAQNNLRNGGDDIELSGQGKKILIELFDLHGLLVREAIQFVNSIFSFYGMQHRMIFRFIVGRGNHSIGGVARLGPALRKYLENRNIPYTSLDGEVRARVNA